MTAHFECYVNNPQIYLKQRPAEISLVHILSEHTAPCAQDILLCANIFTRHTPRGVGSTLHEMSRLAVNQFILTAFGLPGSAQQVQLSGFAFMIFTCNHVPEKVCRKSQAVQ